MAFILRNFVIWLALGLILAILASFQNSLMIFMGYCCWSSLRPILTILASFHICPIIFMGYWYWVALRPILAILARFRNLLMIFIEYQHWPAPISILACGRIFTSFFWCSWNIDIDFCLDPFWRYWQIPSTVIWFSGDFALEPHVGTTYTILVSFQSLSKSCQSLLLFHNFQGIFGEIDFGNVSLFLWLCPGSYGILLLAALGFIFVIWSVFSTF